MREIELECVSNHVKNNDWLQASYIIPDNLSVIEYKPMGTPLTSDMKSQITGDFKVDHFNGVHMALYYPEFEHVDNGRIFCNAIVEDLTNGQ